MPMTDVAGRKRASPMIYWVLGLTLCMMKAFVETQPCFALDRIEAGETIVYDIKKLKVTVGKAQLVYHGMVEVNKQRALSVTVTATGFKFFDKEQLYLDPETFRPMIIERNLDIFGQKEDIIEFYDAQKGKVKIVKRAGGKTEQKVIEEGGRFDNIYGYIYRQRLAGQFNPKDTYDLHLPTLDVRLKLMETKHIEVNDQSYKAYLIASEPKKYKVWFDSGPRKLPLKIDGAIGWGKMSMVIREQVR